MLHRAKRFTSRLCACAIALLTLSAVTTHAAEINIFSSQSSVTTGNTFSVFFEIRGLSAALDDSLSGFDLDVHFDPTLLALSDAVFLDPLTLVNQLDLPEVGSLGFINDQRVESGVLDILALSGNSASVLDQTQANAFRFLTLTFTALGPAALATISVDPADLGLLFLNSSAGLLAPTFLQSSASVAITAPGAAVPEPSSILLLIAGVALLLRSRSTQV